MNRFDFHTDQFGVSSEGIALLRSDFTYKEFKPAEIERIEIKRGIRIKNRMALLVFGVVNFLAALYCVNFAAPLDSLDGFNIQGGRLIWAVLMVAFTLLAVAFVSFYQVFIPTTVLTLRTKSGYWNVFSLYKTAKSNKLNRLINAINSSPLKSVTKVHDGVRL